MKINQTIKILICLVMVFLSLGSLVTAENKQTFTPKELAKYTGQNGAPAYVAVNGVVYDLTNVPSWANGRHYCSGAIAGKDITFLWNLVPPSHKNPNFLKRFPVVGRLIQSTGTKSPSVPTRLSLGMILIFGLLISLFITIVWFLFRLKYRFRLK